jgi:hypothetical protein
MENLDYGETSHSVEDFDETFKGGSQSIWIDPKSDSNPI